MFKYRVVTGIGSKDEVILELYNNIKMMSIIVPWAFIKTTILDMVRTKASDNQNRDWGEASSIARAGSKYQKPEEIPSCKRKHDLMTS